MTDLSITVAQVLPGTDGVFEQGIAGATITAGQPVYLDTTANTYKLADADLSAAAATVAGIALHGALAGQPLRIQVAGSITLGAAAAMTVGETYILSDTAGGISPIADVDSTDYVSYLGIASAAGVLKMHKFNSGVVHA